MLIRSVVATAVNSYFQQSGEMGYSLCKGGLFFHAVGCAETARSIAVLTQAMDPQQAYTAGLMHDIGKVVLDQYIAKACPVFFRGIEHKGKAILEMEKAILGTNHCTAGKILAEKWRFPGFLNQVIAFHHTPERSTSHQKIVSSVFIADLIMSRFNTGLVLDRIGTQSLETALTHLKLTLSDLPDLIDAVPVTTFTLKETLPSKGTIQ